MLYCAAILVVTSLAWSTAVITGQVQDEAAQPIEGARVEHTGKPRVGETNSSGQFSVDAKGPYIVIRKPGYESQRLRSDVDRDFKITLKHSSGAALCKVSTLPKVKTKQLNDVDYVAKLFYIKTKTVNAGILSGKGGTYSRGLPGDPDVWNSVDYFEVMSEKGVIDASGHKSDGTSWRSRTIFGAAAHYYNVDQASADLLDCLMDSLKVPLDQ